MTRLARTRPAAFLAFASLALGTTGFFAARAAGAWDEGRPTAPKTVITGSRMNLLNKGDSVEFVGGVKVVRGNDFLSADKVLSEEKKGRLQAWGNVYLKRDVPEENIRWEAWSQEGVYETDASSATLWNRTSRVRLRRSALTPGDAAKESVLEMKAVRVTVFEAEDPRPSPAMAFPFVSTTPVAASTATFGGLEAQGEVYVFATEVSTAAPARKTEIWSDAAFFDGRSGRATFWNGEDRDGRPSVVRSRQEEGEGRRVLKGETLVYHMGDQRLVVQGRVSAQLWGPMNSTGPLKSEGR